MGTCETSYHVHEVEEDSPKCETQMMEKCREVTQGYTTSQECDKWPQQVCTLSKQTVKKYSPETECEKVPYEVCGPGRCPITSEKQCRNEQKTVVQERPEETCSLRSQPYCQFKTKLVPLLKPRENCVDVPKEVCVRMRTNPRKVKKPVIKKWCYTPTEESGLVSSTDDNDDNDVISGDTEGSADATADNNEDADVVPSPSSTASPVVEVTTSETAITFPASAAPASAAPASAAGDGNGTEASTASNQ